MSMKMNGVMSIAPTGMSIGCDRHFDNTVKWHVNDVGTSIQFTVLFAYIFWCALCRERGTIVSGFGDIVQRNKTELFPIPIDLGRTNVLPLNEGVLAKFVLKWSLTTPSSGLG